MDREIRVPIWASVSRKTGEITFGYSSDPEDVLRFGQVMNRIGRMAERFADEEEKARADAFRSAATNVQI